MAGKEDTRTGLEIAVIGMACRFPGAKNIDEFWDNLKNGMESISFFSDKELAESGIASELLEDPNYVKAKGILEGIEYFDASFFDYRPGEVEQMDPQIRIFHECTWEALEDAGYAPESYKGSIGLYAGATTTSDWESLLAFSSEGGAAERMAVVQLVYKDFLTTSISYKFNLKGPSFPIQTACSTSLVAIHLACQGLLSGECDIALAGGVSVTLPLKNGYQFQEGMIMSTDGHCRSFDEKADGTVFGNGGGVVVLKTLEEAISEGDTIHAVIKGSAINNDGNRKVGFTAPSTKGQAEVISSAIKAAEVDAETILYVDGHGTGTSIGDPIEIEALKLAFDVDRKGFCHIGSVKSNIGHMDAAAGAAGFIKVVLSLKHRLIPPSLHFNTPNPRLDLENTPFCVNAELSQWENGKYPLRAGISSFGFGGTNAHAVLQEAPEIEESSQSRSWKLLLLSAKTISALDKITGNLVECLKTNPGINLADAAYTLQVGRSLFKHRRMLVCSDVKDAVDALETQGSEKVQTFYSKKEKENKRVVFMFPGQGSQYENMGLELYQTEPVFRETMDRCFEILEPIMGYNLKETLYPAAGSAGTQPAAGSDEIDQTEITQPVIFIFEYALAKLLMEWGIKPYAMIGHSIGEYAAACLSEVFSLEDALKLVVLRGKLMQKIPSGAMLSIQLPPEQLEPLLLSNSELSLAAVNTPELAVVSGPHEAIDRFADELKENGYESRRLHTSHAFHSPMMEPILKEFEENVGAVPLNNPQIPYISNVTGTWIKVEEAKNPGYWSKHLRQTIRFSDGLSQLLKKENTMFMEIGPGRVLSTFVMKHPDKNKEQKAINLARHPKENISDIYYLLSKIGQLWLYGITIDWQGFYSQERRQRIQLPTYPFEHQRYWKFIDGFLKKESKSKQPRASLPLKKKDISEWFYIPSWKRFSLPLNKTTGSSTLEKTGWLVFVDKYGVGMKLIERLEKDRVDVVCIEMGSGFGKVDDRRLTFTINPGQADDYITLFDELGKMGRIPGTIVHLWSLTGNDEKEWETISLDKSFEKGFYSLLYLARAIGNHNITKRIRVGVVTNNMQEVTGQEELLPTQAAVLGVVKVFPQEYPNIDCHSIDIEFPKVESFDEKGLVEGLLSELTAESSDTVVAFRGNYKWVQTYEPKTIDEAVNGGIGFREKGVYLITGGLGGIGLALAEYLAKNFQARLILTGRSTFPARNHWDEWLSFHSAEDIVSQRIRKLLEFEQLGAEVLVMKADVADEEQMQAVLKGAEERFAELNGVIHAAGLVQGATFLPIGQISKNECEEQFQSKVYGLMVLEKVLQGKELDLCLLTSSLSSVLGGLGYVAYASANIFMDAFVYKHNRLNPVKWTTANLDAWQTGEEQEQTKTGETGLDKMVIAPEQGVEVLKRILSCDGGSQVVVSTGDLQTRINQWIKLESVRPTESTDDEDMFPDNFLSRPDLSTPYVTPGSRMEEIIADIWQKFLGIDKIGIHDNFFDLGATSLDIIQVNNKLKEALNKNIPVVRMFEFPTVGSLAKKLSSEETGENLAEKKKDRTDEMLKGRQVLQDRRQLRKHGGENVKGN